MNKKVFRVLGYIFCGVLICLCILLIIAGSVFGAEKSVDVFGANVFIVDSDDFETAPRGSAALVKKGNCADLEVGNLVLYRKAGEPTLGYVRGIEARDGVYYVTVSDKDATFEFPEAALIGRADFSSKFLGSIILFIKTPLGIMLVAVLPCAALILYDIIRTAALNRPGPEVVPTVINADEETPHSDIKLSVDTEGKARYSKDRSLKPLPKDNTILFDYSGKQKTAKQESPRKERPIIPLTDKKAPAPKPQAPEKTGKKFDVIIPADDVELNEPKAPRASTKTATLQMERTAEMPQQGEKKKSRDAFFAQSAVGRQAPPKIGGQSAGQVGAQRRTNPANQPSPQKEPAPQGNLGFPPKLDKTAGKRSTQILASKSFDDLLSDDDDNEYPQSKRDKALDDILSGLTRRNN
ncbi:MAG: hypothetical protein K2J77_12920 [Oscillospiraceae bacterium]|nr:hypothetical protein [Oscillospiraceae bacterium]